MDFNSRYKNADNNLNTIKTNAGAYDGFDDMDIMEAESRQKHRQVSRASQARGSASRGRKSRKQMLVYAIIIAVEVIALVIIWSLYFSYNSKLKDNKAKTESSENSGGIDVDNAKFSLKCTKIQITTDANGSPVASIRFTFTNKTDSPLSMAQVFAPSFKQAGADLSSATALTEDAPELYNKDTQVQNGESIECWYTAVLQDTTSEITITMHDNYETFSDIGTTVVPIS